MAITFFGSANNPTDDGSLGGPGPIAVTPPASMVAGDLVILAGQCKTAEDITVSETGGQSWTALDHWTGISGVTDRVRLFYARFNGTWSANPSLTVVADTDAFTVVMMVFRPSASSNTWAIDVAQTSTSASAPATPFDVTITGITTLTDGALVFAGWATADNNTWALQTGGWANPGLAQYRNSLGTDQSMSFGYLVKTPAGATGNVTNRQATLGGDSYHTAILAFKEQSSLPTGIEAIIAQSAAGGVMAGRRYV